MKLRKLPYELTVCKVAELSDIDQATDFFFVGKTDEELSLVCLTKDVPERAVERSDGWRGFRIVGTLDFSLVGILSKLSTILAENNIGIFAVSTFNTDYILVKEKDYNRAMSVLEAAGYEVKEA
ncbi:MAG: ACT domain-containing protein [Oscillospiraceae bacterium]|nr:ACT domain-containing protein [Oscillospiraceae bacterium]